jgi:hypothetical protein
MKCFHFTNGLLISTLALGAAACSSSSGTATGSSKDGGAGGSTSSSGGSKSTGGATGSTGGSKSTGGATGSTGGSKSTGGTPGDAGGPDGGAASSATCGGYCTANLAACTGTPNSRYASRDACLTACAAFPATGHDGDTAGNTLQCRVYHTTAAANGTAADKTLHCPHTGITPTAFCI